MVDHHRGYRGRLAGADSADPAAVEARVLQAAAARPHALREPREASYQRRSRLLNAFATESRVLAVTLRTSKFPSPRQTFQNHLILRENVKRLYG